MADDFDVKDFTLTTAKTIRAKDVGAGKLAPLHINVDNAGGQPAYKASATFTPAAAAHGAGDVVATAQEIDFNAPSGAHIMITSATLLINSNAAQATAWRLHLYSVTPPSAHADNDAWDLPSGDQASYLGYVDLGTAVDVGSTQWVEVHGINKQIKLAGDSVFGELVEISGITTVAVAHIVTLHAAWL